MDNKIQLKEGEVVCDKCYGTCHEPNSDDNDDLCTEICGRCLGHGKLDWIENIVGKIREKRKLSSDWTISSSTDIKTIFSYDIQKEIIETLAKEIAKEVDEEILRELTRPMGVCT